MHTITIRPLNLEKDCVIIRKEPDEDGNWGDLIIKRGLKRRAQTRPQDQPRTKSVLENLIAQSKCRHVFSQPKNPDRQVQPWVLESEMGRLRERLTHDKIKVDSDAGLHTLRHTFLTEAGEHGTLLRRSTSPDTTPSKRRCVMSTLGRCL